MKYKTTTRNIILVLVLTMLAVSGALAAAGGNGNGKIARDLQIALESQPLDLSVIITYRPGASAADIENVRGRSGDRMRTLRGGRFLAGKMDALDIEELATDPSILSISPDRKVFGSMDTALASLDAVAVQQDLGYTGAGITVALLDSGLHSSASVESGRILAGIDFTGSTSGSDDRFGHGTHIAGTIGGNGADGTVRGIAPGVDFVSLKVLNDAGEGRVSAVIEAIEWAMENQAAYGIRIMNLSLGHPVAESYRTDPLTLTVAQAWASGITVIVSAGNNGRIAPHNFTSTPPATARTF